MDPLSSPSKPAPNGLHQVDPDASIISYAGVPNATGTGDQDGPIEDLWGSILNSVKSTRAIVTKNVILLGEPKSGKSTLLSSLASNSPSGFVSSSSPLKGSPAIGSNDEGDASGAPAKDRLKDASQDLGLAYGYFDVGDEKDRDEIVARVGVYTLHSSHSSYTSLLPFAFPAPIGSATADQSSSNMAALASAAASSSSTSSSKLAHLFRPKASIEAIQDSLILITLDWEQPWTFLEQLRNWLEILRELIDSASDGYLNRRKGDTQQWSKAHVALDEMREKLETYLRSYVEPQAVSGSTDGVEGEGSSAVLPAPITALSSALDPEDQSPLTDGMLTDNWGVPIVVACTKSDLIGKLERDKDFKEEQFDYIQQVLRTICMKYGAGLFFTSHTRAQSFDILRSYLLHRLFTPTHTAAATAASGPNVNGASANGTQANAGASGAGSFGAAGGSTAFPFTYRASTTDRDTLLVPSGWDSWGKIRALRDGFDCKGMGRGWEYDCEYERLRRQRGIRKGDKEAEDQLDRELERDADDKVPSAVKLYDDIVADWEAGPPAHKQQNRVKQPDEQAFLAQHYSNLQKDPDPRSKFGRQSAQLAGNASAAASEQGAAGADRFRGVVGPMGGSSYGLPSVDKLMAERSSGQDEERDRSAATTGAGADASAGASAGSAASRTTRTAPTSRRDSAREGAERATPAAAAPSAITTSVGRERGAASPNLDGVRNSSRPTSPAIGSSSPGASSPGAPKQSEVLHSFFQSLLKDKGTPSSGKLGSSAGRSSRSHHQSANTGGTSTPSRPPGAADRANGGSGGAASGGGE